ncbi:F-box protein At5g07610-like [Arachis stenosperma]|uniref:F-box protein At5g07610-like n=1 Tax=Arachis stenosperma TaxID=217475 RepID=UPI0025ACD2ED|nr:F-box protein At5g07610-like [Arachis stenosperma]
MSRIKVSKSSSSPEKIQENEDLLTEILFHLGAKTLIRFKCVSKRWSTIISSPYFCHRHVFRHANITKVSSIFLEPGEDDDNKNRYFNNHKDIKPLSLENGSHGSSSPFDSVEIHPKDLAYIVQSFNGLLLCRILHHHKNREFLPIESFFVCNPTTECFIAMLKIQAARALKQWYTLRLMKPSLVLGGRVGPLSWLQPSSNFITEFTSTVQCTGLASLIRIRMRRCLSLRFDFKEERLRDDNMPPLPTLDYFYIPAAACGHLNLVGFSSPERSNMIRVYQMAMDYSRWVLLHTLDLPPMYWPNDFIASVRVLHLIQDSEDYCSGMSLVLVVNYNVVVFRLKDHTFKQIYSRYVPWNESAESPPISFEHIESLVQL